ncbi:MAG: hypothetical protein ACRC8A_01815 [Microcoleaceae cyanobacterium]
MILLYRYVGISLLFICGTGLFSLAARINQNMRNPGFWLAVIAAIILGFLGSYFYEQRHTNEQWHEGFFLILAVAFCLILGGVLQWV